MVNWFDAAKGAASRTPDPAPGPQTPDSAAEAPLRRATPTARKTSDALDWFEAAKGAATATERAAAATPEATDPPQPPAPLPEAAPGPPDTQAETQVENWGQDAPELAPDAPEQGALAIDDSALFPVDLDAPPPEPVDPADTATSDESDASDPDDDETPDWFDAARDAAAKALVAEPAETPRHTIRPFSETAANFDWFDPPTQPPEALPDPAAAKDAPKDAPKDTTAAGPEPLPVRPEVAFQPYVPREAWTREEILDQALKGVGLSDALRRMSRRASNGLRDSTRRNFFRDANQRLTHPEDAFLDDEALHAFRQLVVTRVEDLAMDELDVEEEMPENLSRREEAEWRALGKGLFYLLRKLEQRAGDKPRIGKNRRLHEQLVRMGQDPFTGLPPSDVARFNPGREVPQIRAQFLGFFGPFGAFPLNWTEEVARWFKAGDPSFVAFVDIFTERFQELFFRAWSDAHAITQFDHPTDDRFKDYLLSFTGNGTAAMQDRDAVPESVRARYAGLASGRVKSPVRLRQILQLHFSGKLNVRIEELVPTWLDFEPDTLSHMGMQAATMGMDMHLGSRVRTVGEKIRIHLEVKTIQDYFRLLPSGEDHPHLRDLVFWYLGEAYEVEAVLWLPEPEVQPAVMGVNAQVGWMACIAPPKGNPDVLVRATEFKLSPLKEGGERQAA